MNRLHSSSSSSSAQSEASRIHRNGDVYMVKYRFHSSTYEEPEAILFRISTELFSEVARAAMSKSSVISSLNCAPNAQYLELYEANRLIDIHRDPSKENKICAYKIKDLPFTQLTHRSPTVFIKELEQKLAPKGSVAVADEQKFEKATHIRGPDVVKFARAGETSDIPSEWTPGSYNAVFDEGSNKLQIDAGRGKFEEAVSSALGSHPILPEEKLFTGLRALAYQQRHVSQKHKPIDDQRLEAFYRLIDTVELQLRDYCTTGEGDVDSLQKLGVLIDREIENFPYKSAFFQKALSVLGTVTAVIRLVEHKEKREEYAPFIKEFLVEILHNPLRKLVKCTVSADEVKGIATENLALRSGLLLSQFKTTLQGTCPEVLQDLEKIDAAFRKDDWVTANALLYDVIESDFLQRTALQMVRNFAEKKDFALYKFVVGIVHLADFFDDVVKASPHYRWINFPVVKECLEYLNQPEKALEKGKLALLGNWVKQLHEAGYTELSEESKQLSSSLQKFDELKAKFEKGKFSDWLGRVQNKTVDPQEYQALCQIIDRSYKEIEELLREISLHVNMTQALIVLFAGKKGIPPIEKEKLAEQLTYLNEKINHTCLPFISFLHNFKMLMAKEQTEPNVYALTTFETDSAKLFPPAEPIQPPEEDVQVKVVDESDDSEDEAVPQAVDILDKELKEVFSTNNRRKILENLSAFFKEHNRKVKVEGGKGSHIKIYLGKVPIIIPHSKELKVGTAGSIRSDILDELRKLS